MFEMLHDRDKIVLQLSQSSETRLSWPMPKGQDCISSPCRSWSHLLQSRKVQHTQDIKPAHGSPEHSPQLSGAGSSAEPEDSLKRWLLAASTY